MDVGCLVEQPIPTVDGRNLAPVDMVNIPLFTGFYTSQVVQDFSHQQYPSPHLPIDSQPFISMDGQQVPGED